MRILLLAAIISSGCTAARKVAHTSFRVLDAPAHFVRRQIDAQDTATTTTTTTTTSSDIVTTPGRTVTVAPTDRDPQRRKATTQNQPRTDATPTPGPRVTTSKPSPSPSPRTPTTQTAQYPTAKPVPGKPGYVFSPFDPSGGYVDVNGYTPGQKVKDPYSGKIFLVP
jgi:hypothetical protein